MVFSYYCYKHVLKNYISAITSNWNTTFILKLNGTQGTHDTLIGNNTKLIIQNLLITYTLHLLNIKRFY